MPVNPHLFVEYGNLVLDRRQGFQQGLDALVQQIVLLAGRPRRLVKGAPTLAHRQSDAERTQHPADLPEKTALVANQLIGRRKQRPDPVALFRLEVNLCVSPCPPHLR